MNMHANQLIDDSGSLALGESEQKSTVLLGQAIDDSCTKAGNFPAHPRTAFN